jgi:CRISPR-associated protein Cas1
MLPLYGHSEYSERIKIQSAISEPLKKQLWKQTIEQKIRNQMSLLSIKGKAYEPLETYANSVLSGDTTNREGMAAQYYWKHLFDDFSRERFGQEPNNLLNFGYAVLRSMMARALVSSGLLPVLGIFHKNKYNPYCLADDIMEPYRPFVDQLTYEYVEKNGMVHELDQDVKAHMLSIATEDVIIDGLTRPLLVAVTMTTASLHKCFTGELRNIRYPVLD